MRNGIPGWVLLLALLLIGYLYTVISDSIKLNNYKSSFNFNVDSLQRIVNWNFSPYVKENSMPPKGGCFVFTLDEGKLNVDQSVINSLNPSISPKSNPVSIVAIIENSQVSSGKYSNGSSGVRYYSTIYLFDCSKNAVTYKDDIWGSPPPESGYVRSGGKIKGSTVSANDIANFILSHLR